MKVNICYGGFERKAQPKVEVIMPQHKKEVRVAPKSNDWKYKMSYMLSAVPYGVAQVAQEQGVPTIASKFIVMFDPLVQVMQGLSYPTAIVMMGAGALLLITGNKVKGLQTIKWAGLGFVGMQLLPGVMRILMDVGQLISSGVI